MPLDYYRVGRVIGGKMIPGRTPQFGGFGLLGTVAEALRDRPHPEAVVHFSLDDDRLVCRAFEEVRDGAAPDRILYDRALAGRFYKRCRKLGVHAPDALLGPRLLNIRKNSPRYKKHGISLSPTTRTEPRPSIVPRYAHAIEFALVRLKYRYGVSIDDILLDPELGSKFESIASQVATKLKSIDLRLGALYIRKTRYLARNQATLFEHLDADLIEQELEELGTLSNISAKAVPPGEGLLEVLEKGRYLYVAANEDLPGVIEEFVAAPTLNVLGNHFWTPDPNVITIRALPKAQFCNTSVKRWQLKLISTRDPVFNWPVGGAAA